MNRLSIVSIALQSFIIALYAWTGNVSWSMTLAYFLTTAGSAAVFSVIILKNWNLRFKDKGMLLPQLMVAFATHMIFMVLAPQLTIIFLASMLVFFNFAMIGLNSRELMAACAVFSIATAASLYLGRERFGYPGTSNADIAILWLFFALSMLRLTTINTQVSRLRLKVSEKNRELQIALEKNQELARRDELTGAYNRRFFLHLLMEERERTNRTGLAFCVAILDLDHFKTINDRFGHLMGDNVLREFCAVINASMRTTDYFARYGGEEFVLMLTATAGEENALVPIERLRLAVQENNWEAIMPGLRVTVSCGATAFQRGEPLEELLSRADKALYEAKRSGRNRIVFH